VTTLTVTINGRAYGPVEVARHRIEIQNVRGSQKRAQHRRRKPAFDLCDQIEEPLL
jgi:hypothetical protein